MSKKNSHRPCPALQRGITSKECGGDRHSRIACTEDCPFNPFALQNYDDLLEVEKSADAKARARLFKAMSPGRQSLFASQIRSMTGEVLEIEQAFRFEFFQRPGPDGRDFITTWDEEGWTGLNNDERTYYQGHRKLAPRLMEVHGPVDDGQVTVTDPRQPEQPPFPAMDRTLAATVPRFSILLAWQFPLPHYRRLFCANLPMQPLGPCSAVEVVDEIVRHRSGLSDPDQAARWLALHFNDFAKSYQATQEARLEDTRRLSDKRIFRTSWPYSGPMDGAGPRQRFPRPAGGQPDRSRIHGERSGGV